MNTNNRDFKGAAAEPERMLRRGEVARLLGVCERTISRMVAAGQFPPPVKLRKASRWRLSDALRIRDGGRAMP